MGSPLTPVLSGARVARVARRDRWPPGRCVRRDSPLGPSTMLLDRVALGEQHGSGSYFCMKNLVRHSSEAWSCGPEESSEPRCDPKTSAGKTLANWGKLGALGWQHKRAQHTVRRRKHRALKPVKGCRCSAVALNAARASFAALLSLASARSRTRSRSAAPTQGTRTTKQAREYIDSATTPRL